MAKQKKHLGHVRLACELCDRNDFDFISKAQLEQAIASGWQGVVEVQSFKEAIAEVKPEEAKDEGKSVLDWYTHIGTCPDCLANEGQ